MAERGAVIFVKTAPEVDRKALALGRKIANEVVMAKRAWAVRSEFKIGTKCYRVDEICGEPNSGLCIVEELTHPLRWRFQVPFEFVDALYEAEVAKPASLWNGW